MKFPVSKYLRGRAAQNIPAPLVAEAAVWIARLHGPNRTAECERECRSWLARSPLHRLAFERATATWDVLDEVSMASAFRNRPRAAREETRRSSQGIWAVVAVGACTVVFGVIWMLWLGQSTYATRVGEQRSLRLADGTRLALNTDTRLSVVKRSDLRLIELAHGEAYFEVAKDPLHPFIVDAGKTHIKALGTAFAVRRDGDKVAVTLVEGRISVTEDGGCGRADCATHEVLVAGQRLVATGVAPAVIDQAPVQQVTAWRRGEVILEQTPLAEAIAEMNRYSILPIRIDDAAVAQLPVSGIFNVGDNEEFAQAAAAVHGLHIRQHPDGLLLSR